MYQFPQFDLSGQVEDVGAAPPKLDEPKAVPVPETPVSSPVVQEEAKLESPPIRNAG